MRFKQTHTMAHHHPPSHLKKTLEELKTVRSSSSSRHEDVNNELLRRLSHSVAEKDRVRKIAEAFDLLKGRLLRSNQEIRSRATRYEILTAATRYIANLEDNIESLKAKAEQQEAQCQLLEDDPTRNPIPRNNDLSGSSLVNSNSNSTPTTSVAQPPEEKLEYANGAVDRIITAMMDLSGDQDPLPQLQLDYAVSSPVAMCSFTGHLLECNQGFRAAIGLPATGLMPESIYSLCHWKDLPRLMSVFKTLFSGDLKSGSCLVTLVGETALSVKLLVLTVAPYTYGGPLAIRVEIL